MRIRKGHVVVHDFSRIEGEVLQIRRHRTGYNYLIKWSGRTNPGWYKRDVLILLAAQQKEKQ